MTFMMHSPLGNELQEIRVQLGHGTVAVFRDLYLENLTIDHEVIECTQQDGSTTRITTGRSHAELNLRAGYATIETEAREDVGKKIRVIHVQRKEEP